MEIYAIIGAGALVAVGVVYVAFRVIRRGALNEGGKSERTDNLEAIIKMDQKRHEHAGEPLPLSKRDQLSGLRSLLASRPRRRSREVPDDE